MLALCCRKYCRRGRVWGNARQIFRGAFISMQSWGLVYFFFLVSSHGNSVRKVLRYLSCLFMICSPAKCNAKHEKVFVVVFFPSGKQVYWSQTWAKSAGIHSQLRGGSDPVAEDQIYLIAVHITVVTYQVPYIAWLFCVITVVNTGFCAVVRFLS